MTCDEIDELAGAIALDAVPEEEWPAIREHLTTCTRGHPELRELRAVASLLLQAAPPVEPPTGLRGRILAAATAEAAPPPAAAPPVGTPIPIPSRAGALRNAPGEPPAVASAPAVIERRDRSFWQRSGWIAAAASVVVAAALGIWAVSLNRDLRDTEDRLGATEQQLQRDQRGLAALAGGRKVAFAATIPNAGGSVLTPAQGNATLVLHGLPRSDGQVYQVWALQGGRPTSLGVFNVNDDGPTVVPLEHNLRNADTVAITVEPGPNGSPGPTSVPIRPRRCGAEPGYQIDDTICS